MVTFLAGHTVQTVRIPVFGDTVVEPDEELQVRLGNPLGGTLAVDNARVVIANDDSANLPPTPPAERTPANRATGVPLATTLAWTASDPEGDPLRYDVHLGTALTDGAQRWRTICPATPGGPAARAFGAWAFDDASDRLMLFGGAAAAGDAADLWILRGAAVACDAAAWTQVNAPGAPSARKRGVAIYHPGADRFIVQGGCTGACTSGLAETWALDGASSGSVAPWQALPSAPVALRNHAAALDAANRRLILFGGLPESSTTPVNDVWILTDVAGTGTPAWQPLTVTGPRPPARSGATVSHDATSNRLILFGGRGAGDVVLNDVWVLAHANGLSGAASWTQLTPASAGPAGRWAHGAGYDPGARRLLRVRRDRLRVRSRHQRRVQRDLAAVERRRHRRHAHLEALAAARPHASAAAGSGLCVFALPEPRAAAERARQPTVADPDGRRLGAGGRCRDPATGRPGPRAEHLRPHGSGGRRHLPVARGRPRRARRHRRLVPVPVRHVGPVAVDPGRRRRRGRPGDQRGHVHREAVAPLAAEVRASFTTRDGTALAGQDYLPRQGGVVLAPGTTSVPIAVSVTGDDLFEAAETFTVQLSAPVAAVLARAEASATILDDDDVPNGAPIVNAGPDRSITTASANLAGQMVDDGYPVAGALTASWSAVSGPAGVVFTDPASASTTATFAQAGTYVLRLSASDSALTGFDDLTVVVAAGAVANVAPLVSAGGDQLVGPGATVALQGEVTDDGRPAGGQLTLAWTRI